MSIDLGKLGYKIFIDDKQYRDGLRKLLGETHKSSSQIQGIFSKLATTAVLGTVFFKSIGQARAFSKELANLKSIAWDLDMEKVRKEILDLNATLGNSAELTNAMYFAYSAGVRGTEKELAKFVALTAELAQTVGSGITPMMDALTTMMNAYGLKVSDAATLTDWFYQIVKSGKTTGPELASSLGQIAATAAAAGISLDELGAALATLTTTMPTNIAVTSLAAAIRAIANPTDDARNSARALGIDLSQTAIQAKGFSGVMQEIFDKTQGRADLIGQLFPAESSRAILSLAGTQLGTFTAALTDFEGKAGGAKKGFEAILESDDKKWEAMLIVLQKLGTALGDMIFQFITLGGILNPVYSAINAMGSGTIKLIAQIGAFAGVMLGLQKAVRGIAALKNAFVAFAIEGGYGKSAQMVESEKMILQTQKEAAIRIAAEKRVSMAQAQAAAENTLRRKKQLLLEGASAQAMRSAEKDIAKTANAAKLATYSYHEARTSALQASAAQQAHNAAVVAGTAQVGLLRGAWNSLKMTMASNPLGFVLMAATTAFSLIMYLINKAEEEAKKNIERANELMEEARKNRSEKEESVKRDTPKLSRLEELSQKDALSSTEMTEAASIINSLTVEWGKFGVELDKETGKLIVQANAFQQLSERMKQARLAANKREQMAIEGKKTMMVNQEIERLKGIAGKAPHLRTKEEQEDLEEIDKILYSKGKSHKIADKQDHDFLFAIEQVGKRNLAGNEEYANLSKRSRALAAERKDIIAGRDPEKERKEKEKVEGARRETARLEERWKDSSLTEADRREQGIQKEFDTYKKNLDTLKDTKNITQEEYDSKLASAQARRDSQIDTNRLAREKEIALLAEQEKAWADGRLSTEEKIAMKKKEIHHQEKELALLQKQARNATSPEQKRNLALSISQKKAEIARNKGEAKMEQENFQYDMAENDRKLAMAEARALYGADGVISEEDKIALKKLELAQQTTRIKELEVRMNAATTAELKKQLAIQKAQESGKRSLLAEEIRQAEQKKAMENAERKRNADLIAMEIAHKKDGKITEKEKQELQALKITQQEERVLELQKQERALAGKAGKEDLLAQVQMQRLLAENSLSDLLLAKSSQTQSKQSSQGSFKASVLGMMSSSPIEQKQLEKMTEVREDLRKLERRSRKAQGSSATFAP